MSVLEDIERDFDAISKESDRVEVGCLVGMSGNDWIEEGLKEPDPKNLFEGLIFENQCTCIFSKSGVGKSILSVQIAEAIAQNIPVCYLDFELSKKQFQQRYARRFFVGGEEREVKHVFPKMFHRFEINAERMNDETLTEQLIENIGAVARRTNARVIIIDNLTFLLNDDSKAIEARAIMQHFMALKKQLGLTLIIIAHCPKVPDGIPLTLNHLSGSSKLGIFFDCVFALGRSRKGSKTRYLKTLKSRNAEETDDVAELELCVKDNGLFFEFIARNAESEHLEKYGTEDKLEIIKKLKVQGMSVDDIAKSLGISKSSVYNSLKL